jgi:hypothetical protein
MRPAAVEAGRLKAPGGHGGISAGRWPGGTAEALSGPAPSILDSVREVGAVGVTDFVCQFEHSTEEEHLASLEQFAETVFGKA